MGPLKLTLEIEKKQLGYGATIGFFVDGKERASVSLADHDLIKSIAIALRPIVEITPNLTQEELENNYEAYFNPLQSS